MLNVLTQTIDEDGNLIGIKEKVDFEEREVATSEGAKAYSDAVLKKQGTNGQGTDGSLANPPSQGTYGSLRAPEAPKVEPLQGSIPAPPPSTDNITVTIDDKDDVDKVD